MLEWSDSFATNIEMVDTQHKKLFDLINNLAQSYEQNDSREAMVNEALTQLVDYANKHFNEEEALMLENELDNRHVHIHQMEHKSFMYDTEKMSQHLLDDNLQELAEKLVSFITSWLTYHILGTDQVMAAQIIAIQRGASPEHAYELRHTVTYDAAVTRLMLNSVLELWRSSAQHCHKLEEKLTVLNKQAEVNGFLDAVKESGAAAINLHPQFITDEQGKRLQAVIPVEEYLKLTKNLANLASLSG